MSFWVGQRTQTVNRPPAPGRMTPGGSAVKRFPNQKPPRSSSDFSSNSSLKDDSSISNDGSGLFPARRGRRGTVQGAPRAPAKRAPNKPSAKRTFSQFFAKTLPSNATDDVKNTPPPITKEMRKEVRSKSGFAIIDDLTDKEDSPNFSDVGRSQRRTTRSSMFRTNSNLEWTDIDMDTLHGDMKEEMESLLSLSNSTSASNQRQFGSSMSLSRGSVYQGTELPDLFERKRSARDGLEQPPLNQEEQKDPTTRSTRKSVAVEATMLTL